MESSSDSEEIQEKCMRDRPGTSETVRRKRRKQKAPPATLTYDEVVPRKKKKALQEPEADVHETSEIYQQLIMGHDVEMTLREITFPGAIEDTTSKKASEEIPENVLENTEPSPSQSPLRTHSEIYQQLFPEDDLKIEEHGIQSAWEKEERTSKEDSENSPKDYKSSPLQSPVDAPPKGFSSPEIYEEHNLPSSSFKEEEASGTISGIVPKSNPENLRSSPLSDLEVALQHDIIILQEIPSFHRTPERTPESSSPSGSSSTRRTPPVNSPRTPSTSSSRSRSTNSSRTPSTSSSRTPSTSSSRTPSTSSSRTPSTSSPRTPSTSSPRTPRLGSPCNCRWRCFNQFSYLERDRVLELAQGQPDAETKFEYLSSLMEAKSVKRLRPKTGGGSRRTVACTYSVKLDDKKYMVCKKAFCSLNGVSKRYVHNISERWKYTHLVPRPGLIESTADEDGDSP
ncbi:histone H3.v1-like [Euwallacea similis]|uniref:histone H3.v1-like n=1 Tax=Euwallacea similis TaxID=1736056 RepID=UPI00344F152D